MTPQLRASLEDARAEALLEAVSPEGTKPATNAIGSASTILERRHEFIARPPAQRPRLNYAAASRSHLRSAGGIRPRDGRRSERVFGPSATWPVARFQSYPQ